MNMKKAAIMGLIYGSLYPIYYYVVMPSALMRVPGGIYYLPPDIAEFLFSIGLFIFFPLGIFYIPLMFFHYHEPLLAPLFGALLGVIVYKVYSGMKSR